MRLTIAPMVKGDLDEVLELERNAFTCPWTREMYQRELERDDGCYLTIRMDGVLIGYGGVLLILEEAHVMTMAVKEGFRQRRVATRILLELIRGAEEMGARFLTLEVRKSNHAAIDLYGKFGFQVMGERKGYYIDNLENALIMWTEEITRPQYRELLGELWGRCFDTEDAR